MATAKKSAKKTTKTTKPATPEVPEFLVLKEVGSFPSGTNTIAVSVVSRRGSAPEISIVRKGQTAKGVGWYSPRLGCLDADACSALASLLACAASSLRGQGPVATKAA